MPSSLRHHRDSRDRSLSGSNRRACKYAEVGRYIQQLLNGSPTWSEVTVRAVRGITVMAMSTILTVALIGIVDIELSTLPAAAVVPQWQTTASFAPLANVSAVSCAPSASPSSATCVAVGDDGGQAPSIIVTENGGSIWSDSTPPSGVTALSTVSCPSASICYAGGGSGILKSSNGGTSWSIQDSSFPAQSISCFTIDECTAVGGIGIVSTDRWRPLGAPRIHLLG